MKVLVTDNDARSALAAVRSLGRAGHTVFVAGETPGLAAASRHAAGFVRCPAASDAPGAFVDAILAAVRERGIEALLPMTEVTTLLLTEARARLPAHCALPFADTRTIALASDKGAIAQLAQSIGVPVPQTRSVASAAQARPLLDAITYPVVIKPARSRVLTAAGWKSSRVSYADDAAQLAATLDALDPALFPVLLQERIRGAGVGFFACYDHGRLVAHFAHRRLREKPPSGGVSVLSESTAVDPQAYQYGTRLLEKLAWHGVAMVEFKRDDRDGSLRLMEINARFWGSLQLAIFAGVDFPALLARLAAGERVAPLTAYHGGVRCRWLLGDLDALLLVLLRGGRRLNLPENHPGRWRTLLDFLTPHANTHHEVLWRDDPGPGWLELRRWLRLSS